MFSFEEVLNLGLIAISWDFWVVIALDKSPNKDFSFALLCRLLLSCCLFSSYIFGLFCRSPIKAIWPQNRICNWSFLEILVYFAHPLPGSIMGAGSNIWPFFISLSWILTIFYKFCTCLLYRWYQNNIIYIHYIMSSAKAAEQHSWIYTFWVNFLLIGTFLSPQSRSGSSKNSQRKLRHHSTRLKNFHDDHSIT